MCGIFGIVSSDPNYHVYQSLVDGLTILQHRGQDAAGMVTISGNRLHLKKENGTVAEVFTQECVEQLQGNCGIGHVRYPTAGGSNIAEAQPLYTNTPFGIALAHNGNLTNTADLVRVMEREHRHINTNSDSELLLNIFAEELHRRHLSDITPDEIFDTVRSVMRRCSGGYAVVMVINRVGMLAFRDPHGIRPLCFGTRDTEHGIDYAVASESVCLDAMTPQFQLARDVAPGEAIFISANTHELYAHQALPTPVVSPCLFEYVYFARPDSIIDGVLVYEARTQMGEALARRIQNQFADLEIDTVMPIPETSRTAALSCAHGLGKPYREGFIKNRYIARTFIMPGQEMRRKTVRMKLNAIRREFEGKNVLLIDDSIVRGTTSKEIIQMAKDAGANKVYFASAAPPVRFCNVYGVDIPTRGELVAHGRNEDEITEALGADKVIYNLLPDVVDAVASLNPSVLRHGFDASCFDGYYVTGVTEEYLAQVEASRGKNRRGAEVNGSKPPKATGSPERVKRAASNGSQGSGSFDAQDDHNSVFAFPQDVLHGYVRPSSISPCLSVGSPIFRPSRKNTANLDDSIHGQLNGIASRGSKEMNANELRESDPSDQTVPNKSVGIYNGVPSPPAVTDVDAMSDTSSNPGRCEALHGYS